MYKFFVKEDSINENEINILNDDVKHIRSVLRLPINEKIEICNIDNSINYLCKIIAIDSECVKCEIIEKVQESNETKLYLHVFQGIPKAEKMENIIQKVTEIGVSEITPVEMLRCIVKLDDKAKKNKIERWQKIAESAAKQSKRDKIPKVNYPISLKKIYEKINEYDIVIVAYEEEKNNSIKQQLEKIKNKEDLKIAIIVGPEGGIDKKEIEELEKNNVKTVTLGKRILRTETAPIVLSSIIMYEFNEMG